MDVLVTPPPEIDRTGITAAVVDLLRAHSQGLTLEEIKRALPGKPGIDVVVEEMRAEFAVYFNPDGALYKLL